MVYCLSSEFDFMYKWQRSDVGSSLNAPCDDNADNKKRKCVFFYISDMFYFLCCLCVFDVKSSPFRRRVWRWWCELRLVECVSQVRRSKGEFVAITSATLSWWHTHSHTHWGKEEQLLQTSSQTTVFASMNNQVCYALNTNTDTHTHTHWQRRFNQKQCWKYILLKSST